MRNRPRFKFVGRREIVKPSLQLDSQKRRVYNKELQSLEREEVVVICLLRLRLRLRNRRINVKVVESSHLVIFRMVLWFLCRFAERVA